MPGSTGACPWYDKTEKEQKAWCRNAKKVPIDEEMYELLHTCIFSRDTANPTILLNSASTVEEDSEVSDIQLKSPFVTGTKPSAASAKATTIAYL